MKNGLMSLALIGVTTAVASAQNASFAGWTVETSAGANGLTLYSVYANFTNDAFTYVFLNCFNFASVSGTMAAAQNDNYSDPAGGIAGSWSPAATTSGFNSSDSYVTATGNFGGAATGTSLDPGFLDESAANSGQINDGAGWYDASPGSPNVIPVTTDRFKVMQVARDANVGTHVFWLRIGFKKSTTTVALFGEGNVTLVGVPAPGALALLGLAGLTARRRRA